MVHSTLQSIFPHIILLDLDSSCILWMRKLRFREGQNLLKVTWPGCKCQNSASRATCLKQEDPPWTLPFDFLSVFPRRVCPHSLPYPAGALSLPKASVCSALALPPPFVPASGVMSFRMRNSLLGHSQWRWELGVLWGGPRLKWDSH